jgi:hypothetical protein
MALAFDYTAAELLPLLPKVQEAVAGALSLPSTPDGVGRVRVAIRGALRRRLALPSQRRLAEATPTATTTVDVSVAMPSADAAAAAAAALTADGINAQLQALGVGPAAVVSAAVAIADPLGAAGANATAAGGGVSSGAVVGLSVGGAVCVGAVSGLAYLLVQSRRRVRLGPPHGKTVDLPSHCAASMEEGRAGQPSCPLTGDMVRLGDGGQVGTGAPA